MAGVAAGLRSALGVFGFFSLFADNFMSPITPILVGLVMVVRRLADDRARAETVQMPVRSSRLMPRLRMAS